MTTLLASLLSSHAPDGAPAATSAAGEDGLFQFLDESHREIQHMLIALREVVDAMEIDGLRPEVRARIREVIVWFNSHAREHHRDEELHVFPSLLASSDEATRSAALQLMQDHGWLEEDWIEIEPSLSCAADGNQWFDLDELRHAVDVFEKLYLDHIVLEEGMAYPEARRLIAPGDLHAMGVEMARRRALREARAG